MVKQTINLKAFEDKYCKKNTIVNCRSIESAREFVRLVHSLKKYTYRSGEVFLNTNYDRYGSETCYDIQGGHFGKLKSYEEDKEEMGYEIIEYKIGDHFDGEGFYEDFAKMLGLEIDEEFKIIGDERTFVFSSKRYNRLHVKDNGKFLICTKPVSLLIPPMIIKSFPKKGERYWCVEPSTESCVTDRFWAGEEWEELIKKRIGVYRTKEEAIEKAKEMGLIK